MSNYAPDPKKERIYSDLATIPLSEVTAEQIETLTNPVTLSASNQDALIAMNIVNKAAMRDGNPMPDTGGIEQYVQTTNDVAPVIRPPKGQVWNIQGISLFNSLSLTGNQAYYAFLSDATTLLVDEIPAVSRGDVQLSATSSSSSTLAWETLHEDLGGGPLILNHNMFLRWYGDFANTQGGNTITFSVAYVNVR